MYSVYSTGLKSHQLLAVTRNKKSVRAAPARRVPGKELSAPVRSSRGRSRGDSLPGGNPPTSPGNPWTFSAVFDPAPGSSGGPGSWKFLPGALDRAARSTASPPDGPARSRPRRGGRPASTVGAAAGRPGGPGAFTGCGGRTSAGRAVAEPDGTAERHPPDASTEGGRRQSSGGGDHVSAIIVSGVIRKESRTIVWPALSDAVPPGGRGKGQGGRALGQCSGGIGGREEFRFAS